MKKLISIIVVFWLCAFIITAQIKAQAGSCKDCKDIESPLMNLEKSRARNVRIQANLFETIINGTRQWNYFIEIYSYSKKLHYINLKSSTSSSIDDANAVYISVNDKKLQTEKIYYLTTRESTKDGKKVRFIGFKPQVKNGKVFDEKGLEVSGTFGENLRLVFTADEFRKFVNAKKIKLILDKETFDLTEEQIREIISVAEKIESNKP